MISALYALAFGLTLFVLAAGARLREARG